MLSQAKQILLLCPCLQEVGGVGAVSRMALAALQAHADGSGARGEVWSYHGQRINSCVDAKGWVHRYAGSSRCLYSWWGLSAALENAKNTLVVATHLHMAPVALPLIKRGAKLAIFLHGIEAWVPLSGLRATALARADVLMANTEYTARRFMMINPKFAHANVTICHLGVTTGNGRHESRDDEASFALIVGRLAERDKGHDRLLNLWPQVLRQFPTARLVIAGDGPDRPRLESLARELNLQSAVDFRGRVNNSELPGLYQRCAFFVMPSKDEGLGLVFLEAMREGKACIGSSGAPEEVIEDGRTGFIVSDEPDALLKALLRLFGDPLLREKMGRAGQQRFHEHFTLAHFHKRFLEALGQDPDQGTPTVVTKDGEPWTRAAGNSVEFV